MVWWAWRFSKANTPPEYVKILAFVDKLIELGTQFEKGSLEYSDSLTLYPAFVEWRTGYLHMRKWMEKHTDALGREVTDTAQSWIHLRNGQGRLRALKRILEGDMLQNVERMIFAKAFSNLLQQADHLQNSGYYVAAGVLGRAILEEHLRKLCADKNSIPTKAKPTINDLNNSLYTNKHFDMVEMKYVDAMATIGNLAAHNKPELTADMVDRLLDDVRRFTGRNPLL